MRVIHINFDYGSAGVGGAGVAASRLHRSMLSAGIDSRYFCTFQREGGEGVVEVPQKGLWRSLFLLGGKAVRHAPRLFGQRYDAAYVITRAWRGGITRSTER
jgi:hypothetical protein